MKPKITIQTLFVLSFLCVFYKTESSNCPTENTTESSTEITSSERPTLEESLVHSIQIDERNCFCAVVRAYDSYNYNRANACINMLNDDPLRDFVQELDIPRGPFCPDIPAIKGTIESIITRLSREDQNTINQLTQSIEDRYP